jgi:hypothetical protein
MAIFAVIFAKERFQADGAYYLLLVIDSENFRIEHQRYILIFSQLLPLTGAKMGLSPDAIIILNSLNNVLFFYGIFCYCVYYLRDQTAGVAVILFQVLGVLHLQFVPMYEVWYGAVLLVPIRSQLRFERVVRTQDFLFLIVLMITTLFSHPLLFIPVIFIILLDALEKWLVHWKLVLTFLVVFAGWYAVKKLFLTEYEAGKLSLLDFSWNKAYRDLIHPGYYWHMIKYFFTWYTIPVLMFIFSVGFHFVRGSKRKAWLIMCFFFGHILLISLTHEPESSLSPYFERMYMPLIAICVLPFLYDIFIQLALTNAVGAGFLALIISWRIWRFVDVGLDYKARTEAVETQIAEAQKLPGSKFEMAPEDYKGCFKFADWSYPMETLLRSAAMDPSHPVSIVTFEDLDEGKNRNTLNENLFLYRRWDIRDDGALNAKYFKIQHGNYVQLAPVCGKVTLMP